MSQDALVVAKKTPTMLDIKEFATAHELSVTGHLESGLVLENADGIPILVLDPPVRVGLVWWLELHVTATSDTLELVTRFLVERYDGEISER